MCKKILLFLFISVIAIHTVFAACAEDDYGCQIQERQQQTAQPTVGLQEHCDEEDTECRLEELEQKNAELEARLATAESDVNFLFEVLDFVVCDVLNLCGEEEIACSENIGCPQPVVIANPYCQDNNLVIDSHEAVCQNPGTVDSFCGIDITQNLLQVCEHGCSIDRCLEAPVGGKVIFRTNVRDGDYFGKTSDAWIALDRNNDQTLEAYGVRGRSSWHNARCNTERYCSEDQATPCILVKTPTGDKVVDYGNANIVVVCDELNHNQVFYRLGDNDASDAELSNNPTEPYSSNNQEVETAGNPWQKLPDFPLDMSNLIAEAVNGKIYAGAGGSFGVDNGKFYEFDFSTNTWTQKSNPSDIYDRASVNYNGRVYAFGGVEHGGPLSISHMYDPQTNAWQTITSLPITRVGTRSGDVVGNQAFVMGGGTIFGPQQGATINYAYNFDTNTWEKKADMPRGRLGHASVALNGKIYVIGGTTGTGSESPYIDDIDVYDPATDSWTTLNAKLPTLLHSMVALPIKGKIYIFGGSNQGVVSDAVLEFNPVTEMFVEKTAMSSPRTEFAGTVLNDIAYLVGGRGGSTTKAFEAYNPALD